MDKRPIGVFDSGLGGLTAVKEFREILPCEDIIYLGDTGRVPYGTRSNATIRKYANQDIRFLCMNEVKYIVIACGTVSCVLSPKDIATSVPLSGVLEPTCKSAVAHSKNKRIAVIGTSATINSGAYEKTLKELDPDVKVYSSACPLFVPLVENGFIDGDDNITNATVQHYLFELKNKGVDTLILGCTHYPIIKKNIASFVGEDVRLIDPGKETAIYVKKQLRKLKILNNNKNKGIVKFYLSDTVDEFKKNADKFLGEKNISDSIVRQINIENF